MDMIRCPKCATHHYGNDPCPPEVLESQHPDDCDCEWCDDRHNVPQFVDDEERETMKIRYDTQGNEFIIAGEVDGISVGYERYDDGEGNEIRGELRVLDCELYENPPTERQHEKLAELNTKISDAYSRLNQVRTELHVIETAGKERMEFLKQYKGLQRLEDFLEGRITHFVFEDYGPPKLLTFDAAMKTDGGESYRPVKFKLLTLFGRTGGELDWRINNYSDGSGIDKEAIPCTSYEQALDVYREKIAEHEAEAKENSHIVSKQWIEAAQWLGLSMSDWYVAACEKSSAEIKTKRIAALKAELDKLDEA